MASKSSIAIRRNAAIEQCKDAIRVLWGDEFDLPRRFRDPSMLAALQLEAIANYLDCKAQELTQGAAVAYTPPEGTEFTTVSIPTMQIVGEELPVPATVTIGSTRNVARKAKRK